MKYIDLYIDWAICRGAFKSSLLIFIGVFLIGFTISAACLSIGLLSDKTFTSYALEVMFCGFVSAICPAIATYRLENR